MYIFYIWCTFFTLLNTYLRFYSLCFTISNHILHSLHFSFILFAQKKKKPQKKQKSNKNTKKWRKDKKCNESKKRKQIKVKKDKIYKKSECKKMKKSNLPNKAYLKNRWGQKAKFHNFISLFNDENCVDNIFRFGFAPEIMILKILGIRANLLC